MKFPMWVITWVDKDGRHNFWERESAAEIAKDLVTIKDTVRGKDYINIFPPGTALGPDDIKPGLEYSDFSIR